MRFPESDLPIQNKPLIGRRLTRKEKRERGIYIPPRQSPDSARIPESAYERRHMTYSVKPSNVVIQKDEDVPNARPSSAPATFERRGESSVVLF